MKHNSKLVTSIILVSVLIVILAASVCCAKKGDKAPSFYLPKKSVPVGEYIEGEDIKYTFKVRNSGSADLEIVNVRPG